MPRAREDGLVVKVLPDEVLVYDLERHQVHCLNRAAAFVWEHCDGRATVTEVAALLRKELKNAADEEVVWLALNGLRRAGLLRADAGGKTEPTRRVSRRDLIRKLATAAAVLLPLITSIVVPEAAAAQSINCASFTTKQSCENPVKVCDKVPEFFCRWQDSQDNSRCKCSNS
jgi:hypothetical protein